MKSVEQLRTTSSIVRWGVLASAGTLALTGCSTGEAKPQVTVTIIKETETDDPGASEAPSAGPVLPSTSNGGPGYTASYQFDYRGGNSLFIKTYPGTTEATADKIRSGLHYNGETFPIDCQQQGRMVHTTEGEHPDIKSTIWYRLLTGGDPVEYAPKTYGDITVPKGVTIPEC